MGQVLDIDFLRGHRRNAFRHDARRNAAIVKRSVVRRPAEIVARAVKALRPGVVRELMQEFERFPVALETKGPHAELQQLPVDHPLKTRVTHAPINPVIKPVVQVIGLRVGVLDAPALHQRLPDVGVIVPLAGFEEKEARRLADNHAAIGKDEACRQIQVIRKDGELIGLPGPRRVLADLDVVVPFTALHDPVRIVPRLRHPKASALIPGKRNRLGDVGLAGEELQMHVHGNLRALHAALHAHRMLISDRLRPALVIRHIGIRLAHFRRAPGEETFPFGPAHSARGVQQLFPDRLDEIR